MTPRGLYGLNDRGVLVRPGYLADINVIDFDELKLQQPWLAFDLPAGGKSVAAKGDWLCRDGQIRRCYIP